MRVGTVLGFMAASLATPLMAVPPGAADSTVKIKAHWTEVQRVSQTVPTTQHLANALTLRTSPLNRKLLQDLHDLKTNDTRLQLWFSVPRQAIPELKEPTDSETFWDFTYIDPVVEDFFANTAGVHHINVGTVPRWMFKVPAAEVPADPAASFYPYTKDTSDAVLKDPSGKQFAEYQARIFAWYTQGGFTDELGKFHKSPYHYTIEYWGVMNEPSFENHISVEQYTKIFDAVAIAIHKIDPHVQFFGPEIVGAPFVLPWARYFLNPKNHDPSAPPVQWFSFHNYVMANNDPGEWQKKFFTDGNIEFGAPAYAFADQVRDVMRVRDELAPTVKIAIDELGTFDVLKPFDMNKPDDTNPANTSDPYSAYAPLYWVASGANWAANFITAEKLGIELISMTQMVGAPTQSESCSMINWDTAQPNAHYWVLSLINHHFGPGDKLVATDSSSSDVLAQAAITTAGRKVLVVNTSDRTVEVQVGGDETSKILEVEVVDEQSGERAPRRESVKNGTVRLAPFAVAVVSQTNR